jgi:hypothetical protein
MGKTKDTSNDDTKHLDISQFKLGYVICIRISKVDGDKRTEILTRALRVVKVQKDCVYVIEEPCVRGEPATQWTIPIGVTIIKITIRGQGQIL